MSQDDEKSRIDFVEQRDGKEAAKKFAEQTLGIYIQTSIDRGPFKDSIEFLREYLKDEQ